MSLFSSVVVPRASLEGRGEVTVAHVLYQVAGSSAGLGAFSCLSSAPPGNYSYSLWDPRAVLLLRGSLPLPLPTCARQDGSHQPHRALTLTFKGIKRE